MENPEFDSVVRETVQHHDLLLRDAGTVVVLMVSGGSDSVALAYLLPCLYPQNSYTVLHINHQLRGKHADKDERFVADLATKLSLPCVLRRIDVAEHAAQTGDNLEQAGRRVRYDEAQKLLDELCGQHGCDPADGRIATAHTRDDRVETFFMRAIVGGGAGALSSIPYRNGRVVRPLLDCSREQLRGYLLTSEQANIASSDAPPFTPQSLYNPTSETPRHPWREDESNRDTTRLRAFVRHEIIPLARSRNPRVLETVARNLDALACDDALLTRLAKELTERFVTVGSDTNGFGDTNDSGGSANPGDTKSSHNPGNPHNPAATVCIDTALFAEDQALVRRVIKAACEKVVAPGVRLTSAHIVRIAEQGNRVGFVTVVPGDVMVANEYGTLVIRRKVDPQASFIGGVPVGEDDWVVDLKEGCPQRIPLGRVMEFAQVAPGSWESDPVAFAQSHASDSRVFIDGDVLKRRGGELYVCGVESGDRFCPLGMQGHHRLVSDVLIDRKVSRRLRKGVGKVCVGGGRRSDGESALETVYGKDDAIVWVVGIQLDERFKVRDTTTAMFSIIVSEDCD